MEFDRYTISLLKLRPDAPAFNEQQEAELQDAHIVIDTIADALAGSTVALGASATGGATRQGSPCVARHGSA